MCQPANNEKESAKQEGVYGVLPYMSPEVLCGRPYTKAADIYSFGIIRLLSANVTEKPVSECFDCGIGE
ncbi:unnamed protein product [Rhizophagus irregularis]|nr:unnamed protein product [Rhizophagus irregularis]